MCQEEEADGDEGQEGTAPQILSSLSSQEPDSPRLDSTRLIELQI